MVDQHAVEEFPTSNGPADHALFVDGIIGLEELSTRPENVLEQAKRWLFLLLLFWGMDQALSVSFTLFSLWSVLTGIELEYVLLDVEEGLGRKVLALTSIIVLAAALIGIYSHADFGFLKLPLFIALSIIVLFSFFQLFVSMSEITQRIWSGCGVMIFTLYLVFDFNRLLKNENAGDNTWPDATRLAIKLYLDIINLILELLSLLSRRHH